MRPAAPVLVVARLAFLVTLTVIVAGSSVAAGAPSGLVAAYSFDAGSGSTVTDVSGGGNTGTITGARWTAAGKSGSALSFDGSFDRVTIADTAALDLDEGMTTEAWVKPSALGGTWRTVLEKSRNTRIAYGLFASEDTGRSAAQLSISNERTARGPALPLGVWSHLAATYDGSTLRLYVNGTLAASTDVSGSIRGSSNPLSIGGTSDGSQWFAGEIDEVRVYNRALTGDELRTDMSTPVEPDRQSPTSPGGLTIKGATQTDITLGWNPSSDNVGTTGYGNYLDDQVAGSGTDTQHTYSGLTCGTSHTLGVDAYDAAGNRSGRSSVIASTSACPDTSAPSAPTGLVASGTTATEITLMWNSSVDNFGVTGYARFRDGTLVSNGNETRYTYAGLACGTSYALGVAAFDGAGNQSGRTSLTVATTACAVSDTTPPAVPQGLRATSASQTEISIAWNATSDNVGVVGYRLYRGGTLVGSTTSLSYTFSGLSCGTTNYLGVEAFDAAGNASYRPESILTAATAACSSDTPPPPSSPPPPPPASGNANLWVDPNGGLCVRSLIALTYLDLSACGSLDDAYDRAVPGDTINVLGGSYGGQSINGDKGSTTPILVQTAPNQSVTINGTLDVNADYVQVRGPITVDGAVDVKGSNPIYGVVVDGVKAGTSYVENAYDLTIKNSEFGPNPGKILMQIGGYPETHRLTLDNVYLHDNPPLAADQHMECIFSTGVQGLTIRNSRTENCGYFGLLSGMCCGATREPSSFVFENNRFGQSKCYPNAGDCPSTGNAPYSIMLSRPVSGQSRIVGNYFATQPALTGSFEQLTAYGNTGAAPTAWK